MGPVVVSAWKLGAVEPRRRLLMGGSVFELVVGVCFCLGECGVEDRKRNLRRWTLL